MSLGNSNTTTSAERLHALMTFFKQRQNNATRIQHVLAEYLEVELDSTALWRAVPLILDLPNQVWSEVVEVSSDPILFEWFEPISAAAQQFRFLNQTADTVGQYFDTGHLAHLQHAAREIARFGPQFVEPADDSVKKMRKAAERLRDGTEQSDSIASDFKLFITQVTNDLIQLLDLQKLAGPEAVRAAMYKFVGRWNLDFGYRVPTTTGDATPDSDSFHRRVRVFLQRALPWGRRIERGAQAISTITEALGLPPGSS